MKKALLTLALAATLIFTGCSNDAANTQTAASNEGTETAAVNHPPLHVANWGLFIYEPVLQMFEEEYGIRVIYTTYSTNEELHAMMVHQGAAFDVVTPSDYMVERMINEGLLVQINWDNIPNYRYIGDNFKNLAFDPQNLYSVPYKWGTFGIVYNTTKVDQVVDSWRILWDEQFAGEIFMYDSSRCTMGAVQRMLGFSMNSTSQDELDQVRNALIEQAPLVRAFLADQIIDNMIGGEGILATVYNGCARWIINYNPDHNFVVPQEGSQLWFNSMVIPATTQNQANAEKFINFMNRPDIALLNTLYTRYSTSNMGAFNLLPEDWQNDPIYWPADEILARGEVFVDLGAFREAFELAWTQVLLSQ
ncbi:MAG: ABC transporter substrate-binding protein [Defluviitaleaceae bacterium]|nr:ABC transporter substrate-binding protein [Defluviitaleaceae bacterium]